MPRSERIRARDTRPPQYDPDRQFAPIRAPAARDLTGAAPLAEENYQVNAVQTGSFIFSAVAKRRESSGGRACPNSKMSRFAHFGSARRRGGQLRPYRI